MDYKKAQKRLFFLVMAFYLLLFILYLTTFMYVFVWLMLGVMFSNLVLTNYLDHREKKEKEIAYKIKIDRANRNSEIVLKNAKLSGNAFRLTFDNILTRHNDLWLIRYLKAGGGA